MTSSLRLPAINRASPATVGSAKKSAIFGRMPARSANRLTMRIACRLWPPSSRKLVRRSSTGWPNTSADGWTRGVAVHESFGSVVAQIADWNRTIEAYVARHPQDCLLVHYDAFVADPDRLRPLFEFLGEPSDPDYVAQTLEKRLQH